MTNSMHSNLRGKSSSGPIIYVSGINPSSGGGLKGKLILKRYLCGWIISGTLYICNNIMHGRN